MTPRVVQTLLDVPVSLTMTAVTLPPGGLSSTGGGPSFGGVGSTTFDVSAHLTDAVNAFGFSFSCARRGRSVPEVQVGAARDMFVTALIRSGAFAVAERQRLNEGVMRERQLNQSGVTAGSGAAGQVAAARYIFEVVVSEANAGAKESAQSVNVGGMQVSSGSTADAIGMDVRIVDAQTGLVVDAVNVVQKMESATTSVSGVGSLLSSLASLRGRNVPVPVDGESRSSRKEGVDRALRSCIEAAVAELARRLNNE